MITGEGLDFYDYPVSKFRWFFISKYRKLMYTLRAAESNKQSVHLDNGMTLNFENNSIERHLF